MAAYDSGALIERALRVNGERELGENELCVGLCAIAAAVSELAAAVTASGIMLGDLADALEHGSPPAE